MIRGVEDNVPGVFYLSSPKGWMDWKTWLEWLSEPRAIRKLQYDRRRILYVDNCSSHVESENDVEQLGKIKTELHKLPRKTTNHTQPADYFVIPKIKDAWWRRWDEYKF